MCSPSGRSRRRACGAFGRPRSSRWSPKSIRMRSRTPCRRPTPVGKRRWAPRCRVCVPAVPPSLPALLRRSGVSEVALGRLQCDPSWPALVALPLDRALVELGLKLSSRRNKRSARRPLRRAAFLGTSGSGRTTALCKWLGVEVFRNERAGRVVLVEFERPNPPGSLPVFCEALGVPVCPVPGVPRPADEGDFVYFDLPGISLGDPADNAADRPFSRERADRTEGSGPERGLRPGGRCARPTRRAAAWGRPIWCSPTWTRSNSWGRVWDYLCDGALEPLFLASGPSLTGNCEEDVWSAVIRKTLGSAAAASDLADPSFGAIAAELSSANQA